MRARLGDVIDDYCVKCKRIMNHSVVSLVEDEPAKVRCRTCYGDHDYRHEQIPPTKAELRKQALYQEMLDKMGLPAADPPPLTDGEDVTDPPASEEAPPAQVKRARAKK